MELFFLGYVLFACWILAGQTLENCDALLKELIRNHGEHEGAFRQHSDESENEG